MNRERILILDDEEAIRNLISDFLKEKGCETHVAVTAEEAMQSLHRISVSAVLVDLVLPGRNGLEFLSEIKSVSPDTEVVIITGYASVDSAVAAISQGAYAYLRKPFEDLEEIWITIQRAFEKRRLTIKNRQLLHDLSQRNQELSGAVQRLSTLNEMGQALHSIMDVKELLGFFVNRVAAELEAERVSLMLLDRKTGELMIEASIGVDEHLAQHVRVRVGEGVSGWVVKEGKPLLVEDVSKDERFQKQTDRPYESDSFISAPLVLNVPVKFKEEVIGVINVSNKRKGGAFSQNDLKFVTTLASQAALAIENVRMFEELKSIKEQR